MGSMIINYEKCTREYKSRIATAEAVFGNKKTHFTNRFVLNVKKKLGKCYALSIALYGDETWTLRKVDQKCLRSFEM
jgi:hypothetical protein